MMQVDDGLKYIVSGVRDVPGAFALFRNRPMPDNKTLPGKLFQFDVFTRSRGFVGIETADPVLGENCWPTLAEAQAHLPL